MPPEHEDGDSRGNAEQGLTDDARPHPAFEREELRRIAGIRSKNVADQGQEEPRRAEERQPRPAGMRWQTGSYFGWQDRHHARQQRDLAENLDDVRRRRDGYDERAGEVEVHSRRHSTSSANETASAGAAGRPPDATCRTLVARQRHFVSLRRPPMATQR
jgi:hypothetical protein